MQRRHKQKLVINFIKANENLAKQGTQEWLNDRQYVIGGSEIATVMGVNRFSTLQSLISQKIGITSFNGNTATRWGSIFENNTELIFKMLFIPDDNIYATGSVPHKLTKNHRYSPDGLCVVKIKNEYYIVLLEFKSPLGSIPDKKIPSYYMPQIKTGLCTIELSEIGLFVNNMYRKCTLNQLNNNISYDGSFHNDTKKNLKLDKALAHGITLFYISKKNIGIFQNHYTAHKDLLLEYESDTDTYEQYHKVPKANCSEFISRSDDDDTDDDDDADDNADDDNADDDNAENKILDKSLLDLIYDMTSSDIIDIIDLGALKEPDFAEFLKLVKPGDNSPSFIDIKYIKPSINIDGVLTSENFYTSDDISYIKKNSYLKKNIKKYNYKKTIQNFKDKCVVNGSIPLAVLPWKLFKSSNIIVTKDNTYLDEHMEKIDNTIDLIKNIMKASSKEEKIELFSSLYPNSDIIKEYNLISKDAREFI